MGGMLIFCNKCGVQNSEDAKYCQECGNEIIRSKNIDKNSESNQKLEKKSPGGAAVLNLLIAGGRICLYRRIC